MHLQHMVARILFDVIVNLCDSHGDRKFFVYFFKQRVTFVNNKMFNITLVFVWKEAGLICSLL